MSDPLRQKVAAVRRRARLLMVAFGLSSVVGAVVGAALLMGLLDYVLRSDDQGVRIICSTLVLLVLGWAFVRFLYPVLVHPLHNVEIAQRIEIRYPELGNRLSSAIQFLDQSEDDVLAGSGGLRRAVIADAAAEIERFDLGDVVDCRRHWRVVLAAVLAVAVVGMAFLIAPASAMLAAQRLALPLGGEGWNDLQFVKPPRQVPEGEDFVVELADRNDRLPNEVMIYYWFEGTDESKAEPSPMHRDYSGGRAVMMHRLANVTTSFRYRAVGGDDDSMEWIELEVIKPPRIESLDITLHPPAYTGWPSESSDRHIRALEGTRVDVSGTATKAISAALLKLETGGEDSHIAAKVVDGERGFQISADADKPWIINKSGTYCFELGYLEDVRRGADARWEIHAVVDRPPTISLERPGADTFVTADAVVPLVALVKDDLAVHYVQMRYSRSDQSDQGEKVIELHRGADKVPQAEVGGLGPGAQRGDSLQVDYDWDLAKITGLHPGTSILFYVAASDYKPQENQCTSRRLTVISADELQERIAQRQVYILGQLGEALKVQQEARSQTTSLSIQFDQAGQFSQQDIHHLQSAELNQRRVGQLLVDNQDGIRPQIVSLLADLDSNRVDNPEIRRRMIEWTQQIDSIDEEHLPVIEHELVSSLKGAQALFRGGSKVPTPAEIARPLNQAGQHQDEVIAALQRMQTQLAKWDSYRRFAREISQLRRDQQDVTKRTGQMRLQTLTKDTKDLTTQQIVNLKRLAQRQWELSRRLDKIQGRMGQMQTEREETDPLAAQTLADALDVAIRRGIGDQMRQSGRHIEANRVVQAENLQEEIDGSLKEMLDVLANRREHELHRLVEKLRQAAGELEQLRMQQKGLRKKMEEAAKTADQAQRKRQLERLLKQQQELQEELNRLARRLKRLQAERAGACVGQAASRLARCQQASQQGQATKALEEAQLAERDLQRAQQELDQRLRRAQQDLADEQFARLEQVIKGIEQQQEGVLSETARLEQLRIQQGRLTRGQMGSVRSLALQQRALIREGGDFAEKIEQAEVFHLALTGAIEQMHGAAERLDQRDTGDETQQFEQDALARLRRLLEALKPDEKNDHGDDGGGAGGAGGAGEGEQGEIICSLAELKLLKMLQEDINQRTIELEEASRRDGGLTKQQNDQLVRLAHEQGRLAELIFNLSEPVDENPESDPDTLPDAREEDSLDDQLDKALQDLLP